MRNITEKQTIIRALIKLGFQPAEAEDEYEALRFEYEASLLETLEAWLY